MLAGVEKVRRDASDRFDVVRVGRQNSPVGVDRLVGLVQVFVNPSVKRAVHVTFEIAF